MLSMLIGHGSILSKSGASTKPGAIHTIGDTNVTIDKLAEPTPTQRRAFKLLDTAIPTKLL
jgi:hypothetical protein